MADLSQGRKETIKLTGLLTFSGFLSRILSIPTRIITAKFLGPLLLGKIAVIYLIKDYVGYSHLGLLQSLLRNVPIAYGQNDQEEVRKITHTVFTGYFLLSFLGVCGLWILYLCGVTFKGVLDLNIMWLVTGVLITGRVNSFLRMFGKAEGHFLILGKLDLGLAIVNPLLLIIGVVYFQISGILGAIMVIDCLSVIYYIVRFKGAPFGIRWDMPRTIKLIKTGFMIFINKITDSLFWSVDLIILALMLTKREVGLYAFSLTALKMVEPLVGAIHWTVYRKMLVETGQHGMRDKKHYKKYTSEIFIIYLLFNALILGVGTLFCMYLVNVFLLDYLACLPAMIILVAGYIVFTSRSFLGYYMNVTHQLTLRFWIIVGGLIVNGVLDWLMLKWGYGITGVALACSLSFILIAVCMNFIVLTQIYGSVDYALQFIVRLVGVALGVSGLIAFFYFHPIVFYDLSWSVWQKIFWGGLDWAIKSLCVFLGTGGLFYIGFRRYRFWKDLWLMVKYVFTKPFRQELRDE